MARLYGEATADQTGYRCIKCGQPVLVRGADVPEAGEPTGGWQHFVCPIPVPL